MVRYRPDSLCPAALGAGNGGGVAMEKVVVCCLYFIVYSSRFTNVKHKLLIITLISITGVAISCVVGIYFTLYSPNFNIHGSQPKYIYIYETGKDFDSLCRTLKDSIGCKQMRAFEWLSKMRAYPTNIKSGRYAVEPDMSVHSLLNSLRLGKQAPVRLTFNNVRTLYELSDRISEQLMLDSAALMRELTDEQKCANLGFTTETIGVLFLPDTYEVWWNISAEKLIARMKREYDAFWTEARRKKAASLHLSPIEVSILASIVEEETSVTEEYPIVAGLYINRLFKGMLLQADPTVKYAVGDFTLKRILTVHLETESPYNTYLHAGLPPGPIRIPSPKSINAVLDRTVHHYIYMCAKDDFSGRHNFAVTLSEHNRNAEAYRRELNRRGIY
jgi:UPF0755 protein